MTAAAARSWRGIAQRAFGLWRPEIAGAFDGRMKREVTPSAVPVHGSSEAMGPLDAMFLHAEDGITHLHIGSCAIFAGASPTLDEITALIASKLPLLHRYRQRVRFVPFDLGHPVWVD